MPCSLRRSNNATIIATGTLLVLAVGCARPEQEPTAAVDEAPSAEPAADRPVAPSAKPPAIRAPLTAQLAVSADSTCVVRDGSAWCRAGTREPVRLPVDDVTGVFLSEQWAACAITKTEASCFYVTEPERTKPDLKIPLPNLVKVEFVIPDAAYVAGIVCSLNEARQLQCQEFDGQELRPFLVEENVDDFSMNDGVCWAAGEVRCIGGPKWSHDRARARNGDEPVIVEGIADARRISMGSTRACVVHERGDVSCWGPGWEQSPLGSQTGNDPSVRRIDGVKGVADVVVGEHEACVVDSAGLQCWGDNYLGSLGKTTHRFVSDPITVPDTKGVIGAGIGSTRGCALDASQELRCWGTDVHEVRDAVASDDPMLLAKGRTNLSLPGEMVLCSADTEGHQACVGDQYGVYATLRGTWWKPGLGLFREATEGCVLRPTGELECRTMQNGIAAALVEDEQMWRAGKNVVDWVDDGRSGCLVTESGSVECFSIAGDERIAAGRISDATNIWMSQYADPSTVCVLGNTGAAKCFEFPDWGDWPEHGPLALSDQFPLRGVKDAVDLVGHSGMLCAVAPKRVSCWQEEQLRGAPLWSVDVEAKSVTISPLTSSVAVVRADGAMVHFHRDTGRPVPASELSVKQRALRAQAPLVRVLGNGAVLCTEDAEHDVRCIESTLRSTGNIGRDGLFVPADQLWPPQRVTLGSVQP